MAANTNEGGKNQVIIPRSTQAVAFFRFSFSSLAVLCGTLSILDAYDRYFSLYMTSATISFIARICIVVVAAAILAGKSLSMLNIFSKYLQWVVRLLQGPIICALLESNCVHVTLVIQCIVDVHLDDIHFLVVLSALSLFMIVTVAASFGSDKSGLTEGLLLQFGKMLVVYTKSAKLWQPIICALVLIFAIISMLTELADVGSDNATALQQKNDPAGRIQAVRQRGALAVTFFRFSAMLITGFWFIFTIMCVHDQISSEYMTVPVRMCIISVTAGIFTGGYTSYVKLLQWLSQRLRGREDKRWFAMFVVTAILDVFLDKHKMLPLALLSALSMITLCILNTGWGITGITDGLLIGFGKWLLFYMFSSKLPTSVVFCGSVLLFAVVSKLSVRAGEAKVKNSRRVGPNA